MIPLVNIQAARQRIAPYVLETPTHENKALSQILGIPVFLKLEILQYQGMFKVRGAFNKMLSLSDDEKDKGVCAVSGGNHAIAVAYAARTLSVKAVVVMPESTPENYLHAASAHGAEVILTPNVHQAFEKAAALAEEGLSFIHPFDDPVVIAGQGTLGLELLEQAPDLTDVVVSIGGGGLMSGVVSAIKAVKGEVRVWGVETEGADAMRQALDANKPVTLPAITSIAKTLGAPAVTDQTLKISKQLEDVIVVPDSDVVQALMILLERAKVLTEPAAACTLVAAEILKARFGDDGQVALILCGGNTTLDDVTRWQAQFGL